MQAVIYRELLSRQDVVLRRRPGRLVRGIPELVRSYNGR